MITQVVNWIGSPRGVLADGFLRSVLKGASPVVAAKFAVALLAVVRGPLIAHYLTPEGYGQLGIIIAFVGLISGVIACRVWETVIKYAAEFQNSGDRPGLSALIGFCYCVDIASGLTAFGLCQLLALAGSHFFFGHDSLTGLLRIYALVMLVQMADSTSTGLLRYFERFSQASLLMVVASSLRLVGALVIIGGDFGLAGLVAVEIVCALINAILTLRLVLATLCEQGVELAGLLRWSPLKTKRRSILKFLLNTNLTATVRLASTSLDTLLLGKIAGPVAAGYYRLCRLIVDQAGVLIDAVNQVLYPMIAKVYHQQKATRDFWRRLRRVSFFLLFFLGGMTLIIAVFAKPILLFIGGREFVSAATGLAIMFAGFSIWGILLWVPSLFLSADQAFWNTVVNLIRAVVLLGCIAALGHRLGFLSAAAGYALSIAVWAACSGCLVLKLKTQSVTP